MDSTEREVTYKPYRIGTLEPPNSKKIGQWFVFEGIYLIGSVIGYSIRAIEGVSWLTYSVTKHLRENQFTQLGHSYRSLMHPDYGVYANRSIAANATVELKPVEFVPLNYTNQKYHTVIVGPSGSGKSTLAKHLAVNIPGTVKVYDPHFNGKDWDGLNVFSTHESIIQQMRIDLEIMQDRFEKRRNGNDSFAPITIICDEYRAIVNSKANDGIAQNWMSTLFTEAGKVAIRLVVLIQLDSVKSFGIEGEGDIRDSARYFRLGDYAKEHAKSIKNESLLQLFDSQKRIGMLDDHPVDLTNLMSSNPTYIAHQMSINNITQNSPLCSPVAAAVQEAHASCAESNPMHTQNFGVEQAENLVDRAIQAKYGSVERCLKEAVLAHLEGKQLSASQISRELIGRVNGEYLKADQVLAWLKGED